MSELVNLKREDIAFDDDNRLGSHHPSYGAAAPTATLRRANGGNRDGPTFTPPTTSGSYRSDRSGTVRTDGHTGMRRVGEPHAGTIIIIRKAKTGRNQNVVLHDASLTKLLHELVDVTRPGGYLFPFSAAAFRSVFKKGCADLGLSKLYVPHSLRHGGATRYKHRLGWRMEDVMHRGRWASSKSAKTYIQASVAHSMSVMVPSQLHELGFQFSNSLDEHLSLSRHYRYPSRGTGTLTRSAARAILRRVARSTTTN